MKIGVRHVHQLLRVEFSLLRISIGDGLGHFSMQRQTLLKGTSRFGREYDLVAHEWRDQRA